MKTSLIHPFIDFKSTSRPFSLGVTFSLLFSFSILSPVQAQETILIQDFKSIQSKNSLECKDPVQFLKLNESIRLKILEKMEKEKISDSAPFKNKEYERLADTAVALYPLQLESTDRTQVYAECGTIAYDFLQELAEYQNKPNLKRLKQLKEQNLNWIACLNDKSKNNLTPEVRTLIQCQEQLIQNLK